MTYQYFTRNGEQEEQTESHNVFVIWRFITVVPENTVDIPHEQNKEKGVDYTEQPQARKTTEPYRDAMDDETPVDMRVVVHLGRDDVAQRAHGRVHPVNTAAHSAYGKIKDIVCGERTKPVLKEKQDECTNIEQASPDSKWL